MSETDWVLEIHDRATGQSEIIAGPASRRDIEIYLAAHPTHQTCRSAHRGLITVYRRWMVEGNPEIPFGPSIVAGGRRMKRYLASIGPATPEELAALTDHQETA